MMVRSLKISEIMKHVICKLLKIKLGLKDEEIIDILGSGVMS